MYPIRRGILFIAVLLAVPAEALSQAAAWTVTAEVGWAAVSGASRDPATGAVFRPARGTVVGLGLARGTPRLGVGVVVRRARSGLALTDQEVTVLTGELQFTLYEIAPEVTMRLRRFGPYGGLTLSAGPVIDVWRLTESSSRIRIGGRAALAVESRLGERISGVVRAEGVLSGSMFDPGELPPGFEWRVQLRRHLVVGVRYRLN